MEIKTVTVDVFDTLLKRKIWPEEKQFWLAAEPQAVYLSTALGIHISRREFYESRLHSRKLLLRLNKSDHHHDKNVDLGEHSLREWFTILVELVASSTHRYIDKTYQIEIVKQLISIELHVESRYLQVDKSVLSKLLRFRQQGKRIYFLSDMYLSSEDITLLLREKGINGIFDGGTSSSDHKKGKHSGKLFFALQDGIIEDFSLQRNLHFGDNLVADVHAPISTGSRARHHKTIRNYLIRPFARGLGRFEMRLRALWSANAQYAKIRKEYGSSSISFACSSFATSLYLYLTDVLVTASRNPNTQFLFVSSEAEFFKEALHSMGANVPENVIFDPTINRSLSLKFLLHTLEENQLDKQSVITQLLELAETKAPNTELLKLKGLNLPEFPFENLNKRHLQEILSELPINNIGKPSSYPTLQSLAADAQLERVVLLDLGWGGTIERFLRIAFEVLGSKAEISGKYLGYLNKGTGLSDYSHGVVLPSLRNTLDRKIFKPVIWEFMFSKNARLEKNARHQLAQQALLLELKKLRKWRFAGMETNLAASKRALSRFLTRPSLQQALYFGNIEADFGMTNTNYFTIVMDAGNSRKFWRNLFRNPVATHKSLLDGRHWLEGTAKAHKATHLRLLAYIFRMVIKARPL